MEKPQGDGQDAGGPVITINFLSLAFLLILYLLPPVISLAGQYEATRVYDEDMLLVLDFILGNHLHEEETI